MRIATMKHTALCVIVLLLAWLAGFAQPFSVSAETKTADLITLEEQGDLTVLFDFETEIVEIKFLSPSGDSYTAEDTDKVQCNEGELWASYRITNAQAGLWQVSYDLGKNTYIHFSIVEAVESICIQSFTAALGEEGKMDCSFEVTVGDREVDFDYEIGLMDAEGNAYILSSKSTETLQEISGYVSIEEIPSGEYTPFLNVYYDGDGVEVFDCMYADNIVYENPYTPDPMSDYRVFLDLSGSFLRADWSGYASGSMDGYRMMVYADDALISLHDLTDDETSMETAYPADAKQLRVELYYFDGSLMSKAAVKEIDLENGEFLKLVTGEVTGKAQAELACRVTEQRYALVLVNETYDEETLEEMRADIETYGELVETDDVTLYIPLEQGGSSSIYVELLGGDSISYIVDAVIFYDMYPPEITLFESLDGKYFAEDTVPIIGSVSDCTKLTVNGIEVALAEDGSFSCEYTLTQAQNLVTIEAADLNENVSVMTLTLYREGAAAETQAPDTETKAEQNFLQSYPFLIAALAAGLLVFVYFLISLRKKKKSVIRIIIGCLRLAALLAFLAAAFETVRRSLFIRSEEFLSLSERSLTEAEAYIQSRDTMLDYAVYALAALLVLLIVPLVVSIIVKQIRRKKNLQNPTEQPPAQP